MENRGILENEDTSVLSLHVCSDTIILTEAGIKACNLLTADAVIAVNLDTFKPKIRQNNRGSCYSSH